MTLGSALTAARYTGTLGCGVTGPTGVGRWDGVADAAPLGAVAAASIVGGARPEPLLREALDVVAPLDVESRGVVWTTGVGTLCVGAPDAGRCWAKGSPGTAPGLGGIGAAPMGDGFALDRVLCVGSLADAGVELMT